MDFQVRKWFSKSSAESASPPISRVDSAKSGNSKWTMTTTSTVQEDAPSEDLALSLHPLASQDGLIAKVTPPTQPSKPTVHVPCDIVLIIDVSGSMGCNAPVPANPGEKTENYGLSVLDLVKHAARTVLETLNEGDRLGIVTFASKAKVVQELSPMNAKNKALAEKNINSMRPIDATNLWHGLLEGIRLFNTGGEMNMGRVPAMMVLTDGMPNHMCPIQGYVPKLRGMEQLPASIHTFGFGYSLRSGLLKSIAEIGGGNYSFIPDAGMIGTVFVHAVANLQATYAVNATLRLSYPASVDLDEIGGDSVVRQEPVTLAEEDGEPKQLSISLGNVQYGQSRDIFLKVTTSQGFVPENSTVRAVIEYSRMTSNTYRQTAEHSLRGAPTTLPESEIAYHLSRSQICSYLSSIIPIRDDGEHEAVSAVSPRLLERLQDLIANLPANGFPSDPQNRSVVEDLAGKQPKGQVTLALSNPGYYSKWGVHYLPSLLNAHARQVCNTFKDPGPLRYGADSPLFVACRDRLDAAFDNLPAPTPSNQRTATHRGRVRMSSYNSSSGVCFASSTPVQLASGRTVPIKALRRGAAVRTPSGPRRVVVVLKTPVRREIMCRVGDLVVTPWHPISLDGGKSWAFPAGVADRRSVRYTGCIYSVLLQPDRDAAAHALNVAGVCGVTLGHGLVSGRDARAHAFFGDYEKVAGSLRAVGVGRNGVVVGGGVVRNPGTGLVRGFRTHGKRSVFFSSRKRINFSVV
ncbi:von Willebrand factor type A domain-containing protein [Colletotrichum navitas]|uniref:von Willebrand factor type A domain-containing protein n=1 Tax=Colletotrichum navitas TaxID=681940 RepID=A0AAD8PPU3_9PEZI|nr:von Willebrand factor type A domain-containing protein [Colletotrichum navitas]KAK1573544.1 von Willebrand factor type A domain-containing protein [Colletotrichum navitas]